MTSRSEELRGRGKAEAHFFNRTAYALPGLLRTAEVGSDQGDEGEIRVLRVVEGIERRVKIAGRSYMVRGMATQVEGSDGGIMFVPGERECMNPPVSISQLRSMDKRLAKQAAVAIRKNKATIVKGLEKRSTVPVGARKRT